LPDNFDGYADSVVTAARASDGARDRVSETEKGKRFHAPAFSPTQILALSMRECFAVEFRILVLIAVDAASSPSRSAAPMPGILRLPSAFAPFLCLELSVKF
jgi:hypothetical protein